MRQQRPWYVGILAVIVSFFASPFTGAYPISPVGEKYLPWWLPDALRPTLARFGDSDPGARVARLGKEFEKVDPEQARRMWSDARQALKIPRVTPAVAPETEVWGVGSNTPD